MFEANETNAKRLFYICNITYEALKRCGALDNDLFSKDINNDEQKNIIFDLALSELRKELKI